MQPSSKRYLKIFETWIGQEVESILSDLESREEKDRKKRSLIKDIKKENYPRVCTDELIRYIKSL